MKLNMNAMLKAVGIGLVIELVMFGINQLVVPAAGTITTTDPQEMLASSGPASILCCVGLLLYGVMGALYGWFALRDQPAVDVGQTALGGGITAVIVSVIGSVIGTIYSLATGTFTAAFEQAASQTGGDTGIIMAGGVAGIVVGFCVGFVLSAGFGAAGGAIYAAIVGRGKPQSAAPGV